MLIYLFCCLSVRVIGLPSEEDWPKDSPILYSISWGTEGSCTKLLHNLGPNEHNLLSVSRSVCLFVMTSRQRLHVKPGVKR